MANIGYFLIALVLFGLFVFVHELGHYLAARATGIGVKELSLGFGPQLLGWQRGDTHYGLRLIPMGGFCQFYGEDEDSDRDDAYHRQKVWKRMITTFAGPFMNFVLAYVAIVVFMMAVGYWYNVPRVESVAADSGAQIAGILPGDVITAVGDEEIAFDSSGVSRLISLIQENPEAPVPLTIRRGDETVRLEAQSVKTENGWQIGITLGIDNYRYPLGAAITGGMVGLKNVVNLMVSSLVNMFTTGEGIEDTGGPVMILSIMTQSVQQGFDMVLNLVVIISLNLGIINLLPLPALDGGHLVLQLVELIRRKPINRKYELGIQMAGFALLMALFVVLTFRDVSRLITG